MVTFDDDVMICDSLQDEEEEKPSPRQALADERGPIVGGD